MRPPHCLDFTPKGMELFLFEPDLGEGTEILFMLRDGLAMIAIRLAEFN